MASVTDQLATVISGDSHLEIDSKWWINRVPEEFRDRAPRVLSLPGGGGDAWLIEGSPLVAEGKVLYGGKGREKFRPWFQSYDETDGTGSADQRLGEQDRDGIDAEVLFPGAGGPRLWAHVKDREAYLSIVHAYNSYLAEEYCPVDPSRLIGLGVIPWTNVDDAIAELEYCRNHGLRGIVLGTFPNGTSTIKSEDDRFWAAALDLDAVVSVHVQLDRNGPRSGPWMEYPNANPELRTIAAKHDVVQETGHYARPAGYNAMQFAMSGVFDRFPDLQVFFAEAMIGWLPLFMEAADDRFEMLLPWAREVFGWDPPKLRPTEYVRNNCYWSFMRDRTGVRLRDVMGVEKLIWATDFPHYETDYPESRTVLDRSFIDVPIEETRLMTSGNVARLFHL